MALKNVKKSAHPYEKEIGLYFSSHPLASDPRNHCVPIYEVLDSPLDPDIMILVMPFLRAFNDPSFRSVGEIVDFLTQIFEVSRERSSKRSHSLCSSPDDYRDCISCMIT